MFFFSPDILLNYSKNALYIVRENLSLPSSPTFKPPSIFVDISIPLKYQNRFFGGGWGAISIFPQNWSYYLYSIVRERFAGCVTVTLTFFRGGGEQRYVLPSSSRMKLT